jgi:hypothetical protein
MDIAVFVGFASAGPIDQPVVVEDGVRFRHVFGDDLPLAWDAQRGENIYAQLGPAVRVFFRNGGRRCWVIRVALKPETDFFPVPGLVQLAGDEMYPAFARARSPGSWFDALECATALASRNVGALTPVAANGFSFDARLSAPDALRPGDLLRLSFEAEPAQLYFS